MLTWSQIVNRDGNVHTDLSSMQYFSRVTIFYLALYLKTPFGWLYLLYISSIQMYLWMLIPWLMALDKLYLKIPLVTPFYVHWWIIAEKNSNETMRRHRGTLLGEVKCYSGRFVERWANTWSQQSDWVGGSWLSLIYFDVSVLNLSFVYDYLSYSCNSHTLCERRSHKNYHCLCLRGP